MKKRLLIIFLLGFFSISFASAACTPEITLLNQDPYPATQGEYVKLVFQVNGIQSSECDNVYFELVDDYPISFDPGTESSVSVRGGTFTSNFQSYLQVPYKVRIDQDAIDGENEIEVRLKEGSTQNSYLTKRFNVTVEDARTGFEVFLKNYNPSTETLTLEILNTGDKDVEALVIEIKDGGSISLRGPSINIVGSLDSNDFTTADFNAILSNGELNLEIKYTDSSGIRRNVSEVVEVNAEPFIKKAENAKSGSSIWYIIIFALIIVVVYYLYRRRKKKKHQHRRH